MNALLTVALLLSTSASSPEAAHIDSMLSAESAQGFSGVVLVALGERVEYERACGRAAELGVPAESLAFWLASDSKQFTATAIMRLQERGALSVRDSLGRFFPNVPSDKRAITLHQLLTHTSGLPSAYASDGVADAARAAERILALGLRSQPGTKSEYSNDGYNLLALVVERTSGVGFDAYLQDSLFTPAGLAQTGLWGHERAGVRIAPPADLRRTQGRPATIWRDGHSVANWGYRGAGGAYATANDVQRWIVALRSGSVLRDESMRELLGHQFVVRSDSSGTSYTGYGWGVRTEQGHDVSYGHVGDEDWLGHNCVVRFDPAGRIVVVLSNSGESGDEGWASRVNRALRRILDPSAPSKHP